MPEQAAIIRIGFADDHPLIRQALRALVKATPDFSFAGEARDGIEAVELVRGGELDVLLLDLVMPRADGFDVLRQVRGTSVKVIVFAAEVSRKATLNALRLGASGVLLKDSTPELVSKCIRCVAKGEHWVGRELVGDLLQTLSALEARTTPDVRTQIRLTPRETEVLRLLVAGLTNRDIAEQFKVSTDTVKHHLTNIFDKTGVSNRLELALYAVHHNLLLPQ